MEKIMSIKRTKKTIILLILLIVITSAMFFANDQKHHQTIEIIEMESFFTNFFVDSDKVYISCELLVRNTTNANQTIGLNAYIPEDVTQGLLKSAELRGYKDDKETYKFCIPKGEERIKVIFIGDFAGVKMKTNRMLPKIEIEMLS
jgi:hypothetical protein